MFRLFLMVQTYLSLGVLLIAAPRIISQERAHNGLPLIYSRPVGRFGYIAGKFSALAVLMSYMTVVQLLFLFVVMWSNYPAEHLFHTSFWSYSVPMLLRGILQSFVIIVPLGMLGLAASAATSDVRAATIVFIVLVFGASFISQTAQSTFAPKFPELGIREVIFASNDKLLQASETARRTNFERSVQRNTGAQIVWGQANDVSTANVVVGFLVWTGAALLFMRWRLRPFDVHGA
ncbi:ABC transporter permease subunit [Candidatus Sumerlaeota bacterium]|nr:ABC transporter permease subunit [Candidatus Sumerlaeota bacterium]